MKRGEIRWIDLEPARGSEIKKTRPGVILTVDALNKARRTVPARAITLFLRVMRIMGFS